MYINLTFWANLINILLLATIKCNFYSNIIIFTLIYSITKQNRIITPLISIESLYNAASIAYYLTLPYENLLKF